MIKVIWRKTASAPQTDTVQSYSTGALPCGHIGATWRIRLNLCFLRPTRVLNPNGISIGSAVFVLLTANTLQWAPLSPKIAPSHGGPGLPSNAWFFGTIRTHNPNGIPIGSAVIFVFDIAIFVLKRDVKLQLTNFSRFCTDGCRVSLYFKMGHRFLHKNCPFLGAAGSEI